MSLVVVVVYDGVDARDIEAVRCVLDLSPMVRVVTAAVEAGPVTSANGPVVAETGLADIDTPAALVVPGGMGSLRFGPDDELLAQLRRLDETEPWLVGISTGALVLAAAGLADHTDATTLWLAHDHLDRLGAHGVQQPVVFHGRLLTAAGAVSAVELTHRLLARVAGAAEDARVRRLLDPPASGRGRRRFTGLRRWARKRIDALAPDDGTGPEPGEGSVASAHPVDEILEPVEVSQRFVGGVARHRRRG